MENLLAARAQMGTSLAFHIVFSLFGVGLPLFLCIAEGLALLPLKEVGLHLKMGRCRDTSDSYMGYAIKERA